jgi:large subunit ribosomal protein L25
MKTVSISGSLRANVGKSDAKELRKQNNVPCVIYGGKEQVSFYAHENAFTKLVYSPDVQIINLEIGGKVYQTVMQEIQFHKVTDKINHIDFLELTPGKAVTLNLPIRVNGIPAGVRDGGKLQKKMRTLKARGPIEKMPQEINIDAAPMKIGDSVRVSDIKFDGITMLDPSNATVVAVRVTRNVVEETPVAAAATTAAPAAGATAAPAADAKKEEKKEEKKK